MSTNNSGMMNRSSAIVAIVIAFVGGGALGHMVGSSGATSEAESEVAAEAGFKPAGPAPETPKVTTATPARKPSAKKGPVKAKAAPTRPVVATDLAPIDSPAPPTKPAVAKKPAPKTAAAKKPATATNTPAAESKPATKKRAVKRAAETPKARDA